MPEPTSPSPAPRSPAAVPAASAVPPITPAAPPPLPPTLMPVSGEDFLPAPGPWARALGAQLLLLLLAVGGALALWPMRETVRAEGIVRPHGENTLVQSERGGTLAAVLVQPNARVQAGQVLARFDNQALEVERQQLQLDLETLEQQVHHARQAQESLQRQADALATMARSLTEASRQAVDQARTRLAFEERESQRYRTLLESGAVPRSLVDEREARRLIGAAEVHRSLQGVSEQEARGASELARLRQSAVQARSAADDLQRQLGQRRARLQQVERELALGTVRAPIDGSVVSTALRHGGQVLEPGAVLAVLAPTSHALRVQAQVPADAISQVRAGQQASLRVAACPTSEFGVLQAQVVSVAADALPLPPPGAEGPTAAAQNGTPAPGGYGLELKPEGDALSSAQGRCPLRLGMQIRADVVTRRTTVLAFLVNKLRLGA